MISRRKDWIRLAALVPLLLLAGIGRSRLTVDVENLAMKSVGTAADEVASLREREFGDEPALFLLASPKAPELLDPIDSREIELWAGQLRARPEVAALAETPTPNPGEHGLSVHLRTDADGRYASAAEAFAGFARASVPPTYRLAVAGAPAVEIAIANDLGAERARILLILGLSLALVLLAIYRQPVLVGAALLPPLAAVFLLDGLQGLLGWSVDPVSALLGPCVLTVGVASSVHVLERYRHALRGDRPVVAASVAAARELRLPLLLTVTTTVAGFLGLLTSPIPAVGRFGVLASVGVVLVVAISLLCLPSLLRLLHRPAPQQARERFRADLRLPLLLRRWSGPLLLACLPVGVAGAVLMGASRVDNDPLQVLSPSSAVRRDARLVARRLGGSEVFELLLPPGGPASPLLALQLTARVSSLAGVVGPAGAARRSEHGYQLLPFLLAPSGSAERVPLFAQAEALAGELGWAGARATGLSVRVARDSNDLVRSQRRGILLTLGALWLAMALGFRSVRLGLLGLVPNVFPLLVVQGSLVALGRPLSVASSMIGVVMLGLVVDDTIHLLHAHAEAQGPPVRRMARALHVVKRPIVITTLVLCVGFSATAFGELAATREFGALAVATLIVALLADLLLLPALLLWRPSAGSRPRAREIACLERPTTTS